MKWFEHQTSALLNKKIRKIEVFYKDRGGQAVMAAIGRFWRLHEIVGNQGLGEDGLDTYSLPRDYGLEVLADDLFCSPDELLEFIKLLAEINSIDADSWENHKIIFMPKLAERADTYTKRSNKIRIEKEQCSKSVRTKSDKVRECVSPQAQAQAQAQAAKKSKGSLASPPPGGNGDARLTPFSCLGFEVSQECLDDLTRDHPQFPAEYLLLEFFPRMKAWCLDNRNNPKHAKKFNAAGRLKNPRSCLFKWLKSEDPGKAAGLRPRKTEPINMDPPGFATVFDPGCMACRGSGRYRDGPCECGKLEPLLKPDPKCQFCGGGGLSKTGPCSCLHQEIHHGAAEPKNLSA